jgi:hypothetical protein
LHLLYLDESGNENDSSDAYFVLAGISLFERQTYFLSRAVDAVQDRHFPNHQPIPFHASEIRSGRGFWRKIAPEKRQWVLQDLVQEVLNVQRGLVLYAAAIEKSSQLWGDSAVERATEEVCRRFDILLQRQYHDLNDAQRGLLIFSEGRFDARAKVWVDSFHRRGTTWGAINNLADIPYFAAMKESRLLQVADLVAHAVWLMYEKRDVNLVRRMVPHFDNQNQTLHGLVHVRKDNTETCDCPACHSRRNPGNLGPWLQP